MKNWIEEMNERTMNAAREHEADVERVSKSQDGSYANKNLKAVFVGGKYNGLVATHSFLEMLGNGKYTLRFSALKVHNENLLNLDLEDQPLVDGYLSPMLDGGMLRYETQEVYNMLSC